VERIIDIQVKQGENGLESCFSELGCERKRGSSPERRLLKAEDKNRTFGFCEIERLTSQENG